MNRAMAVALALTSGCTSVEYVRIPPGSMRPAAGGEPIAAVQVSRMGFYLLGIPLAECDLDQVLGQMLVDAAHRVGADRVVDVHFDATPASGVWWFFTRVLPFPPSARVWGIAVRDAPAAAPAPAPPPAAPPAPPAGIP